MGFIHKKDEDDGERDVTEGAETIGAGEESEEGADLQEGLSAEEISDISVRLEAEGALESGPEPEPEPDSELVGNHVDEEPESGEETEVIEADEAGSDPEEPDADAGAELDSDGSDLAIVDDEHSGVHADHTDEEPENPIAPTKRDVKGLLYIAILVGVAMVSIVIGYSMGMSNDFFTSADEDLTVYESGGVEASLTEDDLDTVVAVWTYEGTEYELTAEQAIEAEHSLDAAEQSDGTYSAPSADTILSYVRNLILTDAAEQSGIEVSDEDVLEYAEETFGLGTYEEIAEAYNMDEDQAETSMYMMACIHELYLSVVSEEELEMPEAPSEPDDGEEDTATEEYANYIIELIGEEWDADEGEWASTAGDFYAMLGDDFDGETATYEQACTAYYVAYTSYYEETSSESSEWTAYVNELYGGIDLTIYGLYTSVN